MYKDTKTTLSTGNIKLQFYRFIIQRLQDWTRRATQICQSQ